jgi:hypothetical protein
MCAVGIPPLVYLGNSKETPPAVSHRSVLSLQVDYAEDMVLQEDFPVAIRAGSPEVILVPQQCRPRCRSHPIPTLSNDTLTGMYVTLAGSMWPMATPACLALPTYARGRTKLDSIGRMRSSTSIWDTHAPPETDTKLSFLLPCDGEGWQIGM